MSLPILLTSLPSTYFVTDIEVALLSRCLSSNQLLSEAFTIEKLSIIANAIGISKKDQVYVFQGLIRHGILYSLSEEISTDYISLKTNYYLSAEKVIQALITNHSQLVIGKKLFKFDIDGELFDGGFITNQQAVFSSVLEKLKAKFGESSERGSYLASFIRMYECIGMSDGRDFFTKSKLVYGGDSITRRNSDETHPAEKMFVIPKYVVLQSHNGEMIRDASRICVCIS